MSDSISKLIEKKIFKVRYIFEGSANIVSDAYAQTTQLDVSFERISRHNIHYLDMIYETEKNESYLKTVRKRIEQPVMWLGFIARNLNNPVGCFWILVPQTDAVLHDSFWIATNEILFCGAYVSPRYRGLRINNIMQKHAYNILNNTFPDRDLIIIVERSNEAAMKSISRSRYLSLRGRNYLFKLIGRNIVSVYVPKSGYLKIWNVI